MCSYELLPKNSNEIWALVLAKFLPLLGKSVILSQQQVQHRQSLCEGTFLAGTVLLRLSNVVDCIVSPGRAAHE